MSLQGKKIILGITGSIAAYKTPQLVRLLIKAGAEVKIVLTKAGESFVSSLTLATVSKNVVLTEFTNGSTWNNHVELGLWADVMVVTPCSANTLAKFANGLCDNLLCAVYLSARCPVFIAPAMDEDMWKHKSTQNNINKVVEYGNNIIPVESGELASGLVGAGRMAEPENIVNYLSTHFSAKNKPLHGLKALVTAGPTYEKIDPVRYIGNFSTGKMGIAIANTLEENGAEVTLVIGPSNEVISNMKIEVSRIECAEQMYNICIEKFSQMHIAVLAAAVADFKPENYSTKKIKKSESDLILKLTKTKDILYNLGKIKQPWQTLVGFALETSNELENAKSKLLNKNADLIVLNSLNDENSGFGYDTNKISILSKQGEIISLPLDSKKNAAKAIVNEIIKLQNA